MEEANGANCKMYKIVTAMMESTKMIRKMDMEYLLGKVETYIKETTKMMREMAMVRCFG